ncbi:MAG: hypothetical protein WAK55_15890 [Xanthobacteraceae bacterium]|jgi:hypothetical protein
MRTLTRTAAALGLIGAVAIGTTVPVMAQGVYLNAPGVHVGVGQPYHRHYGYYDHPYYRDHPYHRHYDEHYGYGYR